MKRLCVYLVVLLGGFLLIGAPGCSSDPNVEGAKLDLKNKDYDRALENIAKALDTDSENAEAHELKGQILQEKAFGIPDVEQHGVLLEEMMTAYHRTVELDPERNATVENQLKIAYFNEFNRGIQAFNRGEQAQDEKKQAELNAAASYFGNAAMMFPDSAAAYINQAYAYFGSGQSEMAIEPFEMAIEKGDTSEDTFVYLADLYRTYGQPTLLKVSGTNGLKFSGNYSVTSKDGSIKSQSVEGTVPSTFPVSGLTSATLQKQTEDGTLIVEVVKGGDILDRAETTASYGNVALTLDVGEVSGEDYCEKSIELLEKAREIHPENESIQAQLMNTYVMCEQEERALQVYEEAVESEPNNKLYRYNYGSLLLELENYDDAIVQLVEAVRIDPEYANAQYNLGAAYVNKAVVVNDEVNKIDDELREKRSEMSEDEVKKVEAEMEELVMQRRSLFENAIGPLENAKELTEAEGGDTESLEGICQALFQSYAQTGETAKAEAVSDCAGYDVN